MDDIFAASGELPLSDSSDLERDLPFPSEHGKANDLCVTPLDLSVTNALIIPAEDDGQSEGHDDPDNDCGYETDTSSLLDDAFVATGELPLSDSDVGDFEFDTAPSVGSHDRYADQSHTTFSTHSHNGFKPNLEDVFAAGEEHQDAKGLSKSPAALLSQDLFMPSQASAHECNPKVCSIPREDILEDSWLESGS